MSSKKLEPKLNKQIYINPACIADTDQLRFNSKIKKTSTCWIWGGSIDAGGYGQFWFNRKLIMAHRFSYVMNHGEITRGLLICHHCDNPSCVNPKHLFRGTHKDNAKDMKDKNRSLIGDKNPSRTQPEKLTRGITHYSYLHPEQCLRGESHGRAKLTEKLVLQIRFLANKFSSDPHIRIKLALNFRVTKEQIGNIIRRNNWKHI